MRTWNRFVEIVTVSRDASHISAVTINSMRPTRTTSRPSSSQSMSKSLNRMETIWLTLPTMNRPHTSSLPGETYSKCPRELVICTHSEETIQRVYSQNSWFIFNFLPAEAQNHKKRNYNARGYCYKLLLPNCHSDVIKYFFSVRTV